MGNSFCIRIQFIKAALTGPHGDEKTPVPAFLKTSFSGETGLNQPILTF